MAPSPVEVSFNGTSVLTFGEPGWGLPVTTFRVPREAIRDGINILAITTSEIKISCLIEEKYTELAVRVLHNAFNLGKPANA